VFVSEGSERVKTATLSFKLNQVLSLVIATSAGFAKKTFDERREISRRMTTTQKKINLDSISAQALFKAVAQVTNEINNTMIKIFLEEK
jgi:hypothetical protein